MFTATVLLVSLAPGQCPTCPPGTFYGGQPYTFSAPYGGYSQPFSVPYSSGCNGGSYGGYQYGAPAMPFAVPSVGEFTSPYVLPPQPRIPLFVPGRPEIIVEIFNGRPRFRPRGFEISAGFRRWR